MTLILLTHLFATLFLVGLIWFVQIVHYPLFAKVGREQFAIYEEAHQRLTTWVVAPMMALELVTAFFILRFSAGGDSPVLPWAGLALIAIIWLSTWKLQVPAHEILAKGFSERQHRRLVTTNWIRTIAWTARGCLVLAIVFRLV